MTPTSRLITITPNMARKFLEKNTMNRPISKDNLDAIIKEINNSNFFVTGESIKIATDGTLLDGQHRLQAIVTAGRATKMFVMEGLEKDAFKYMDTGRTRQASDVLAIEGVKNATKIAAMVKFIVGFRKGQFALAAVNRASGRFKITNAEVSAFVEKNSKSLNDSYGFGFSKGKRLIAGNVIASLHYIFKAIDEKTADDFTNKLVEGAGLTKSSPLFLLREKFIFDSRQKRKIPNKEKIALICKTWNLVRQNKTVVSLRYDSTREVFPKPI